MQQMSLNRQQLQPATHAWARLTGDGVAALAASRLRPAVAIAVRHRCLVSNPGASHATRLRAPSADPIAVAPRAG